MEALRFLIVDDCSAYRAILRYLIDTQLDWVVVGEANDGIEGVRLLESVAPDIVLMDINMPRMNGIQATRQIKQRASGTVVVVISEYDDDEFRHESVRAGADDFLRKDDLDTERLARTINAMFPA